MYAIYITCIQYIYMYIYIHTYIYNYSNHNKYDIQLHKLIIKQIYLINFFIYQSNNKK